MKNLETEYKNYKKHISVKNSTINDENKSDSITLITNEGINLNITNLLIIKYMMNNVRENRLIKTSPNGLELYLKKKHKRTQYLKKRNIGKNKIMQSLFYTNPCVPLVVYTEDEVFISFG